MCCIIEKEIRNCHGALLPLASSSMKSLKPKNFYQELPLLFFKLKLVIFIVAHLVVLSIPPNNSYGELIVFTSPDLNIFDRFLKNAVLPMIRWDAIHMLVIAKYGYVAELQFAFFPLLPMVSRFSAFFFYDRCGFKKFLSIEPLIAILALIFTNTCHYLATIYIFKLTRLLFKSYKFARITALLFLFNAASVQLSSMYTEAPFAFFTLVGLYCLYSKKSFIASLCFALASTTRSNGIVLIGFFTYDLLQKIIFDDLCINQIIKKTVLSSIYSLISLSGFLAFQFYGYSKFCLIDNPVRPWCKSTIPSIYSFVQNEYWNVGFLNYFRFKQIPNFLVAAPMIYICSLASYIYFESDHVRFISLGLRRIKRPKSNKPFFDDVVLPHIFLLIFMLFYNVFIAHVQIITRVFTFMPVVYWFLSHVIMNFGRRIRICLLSYIILYGLIVTGLFSLNYPPA